MKNATDKFRNFSKQKRSLNTQFKDLFIFKNLKSSIKSPNQNPLRSLATGTFNCSRYLATVRRAML
jgi:hypothetical protein